MKLETRILGMLRIDFPLFMAPMFLVSNEAMIKSAMRAGIAGAFPSLNYRKEGELEQLLDALNDFKESDGARGNYGVNLIVQKTNPLYKEHLDVCVRQRVPFYITSLGNPREVIERAHAYGAWVFCDVTNLEHARKCAAYDCDGFIAVGQGAGGHAGPFPLQLLVPALRKEFPDKMVIAAGGIGNGEGIASVLALGADAAYLGTRFIASEEAGVNNAYKDAIVKSKMSDIVLTEKLSGTPCNIINTPYARKIGYKQNMFERFLNKNKRTKKWFKMMVQYRGLKKLEQSVLPANYKTLWCAGQSVEVIHDVLPCEEIIGRLEKETFEAVAHLGEMIRMN